MSSMGPADIVLYTKYHDAIIDLINNLHTKKLIKKVGNKAEFSDIVKILTRITNSQISINKLDKQILNKKFLGELQNYNFEEKDVLQIYSIMIFSQILDLFEILKTTLLATLEQTIFNGVKIEGNETLGGILYKIN